MVKFCIEFHASFFYYYDLSSNFLQRKHSGYYFSDNYATPGGQYFYDKPKSIVLLFRR